MGATQSQINNQVDPTCNLQDIKNNLHQAASSDNLYQFSHYYKKLESNNMNLDFNFISWIFTIALHKSSMNVLRFVKAETGLFTTEIFEEIIEEIVNQHDIREIGTIIWILQNGPCLTDISKQKILQFLNESALGRKKLKGLFELVGERESRIETDPQLEPIDLDKQCAFDANQNPEITEKANKKPEIKEPQIDDDELIVYYEKDLVSNV